MLGILGESSSDVDVLTTLVRRDLRTPGLPIKGHRSIDGCGDLRNRGSRILKLLGQLGCDRFVVCHDSDENDPLAIASLVQRQVTDPVKLTSRCCIVVPVREIESWIIADEAAVKAKMPTFAFRGHARPETLVDPKGWLESESRRVGGKPLYNPRTFNARIAEAIDTDVVFRKCQSYRPLRNALRSWYS